MISYEFIGDSMSLLKLFVPLLLTSLTGLYSSAHAAGSCQYSGAGTSNVLDGSARWFYNTQEVPAGEVCSIHRAAKKCDGGNWVWGTQAHQYHSCTVSDKVVETSWDLPDWFKKTRVQALVIRSSSVYLNNPKMVDIIKHTLENWNINVYQVMGNYAWATPHFPTHQPTWGLEHLPNYLGSHVTPSPGDAPHVGAYYWDAGVGILNTPPGATPPYNYEYWGRDALKKEGTAFDWKVPDAWLCKDLRVYQNVAPKPIPVAVSTNGTRGYSADLTHEAYKLFLLGRFKEMVDLGVETIYLDERHMPHFKEYDPGLPKGTSIYGYPHYPTPEACFGSSLQKEFTKDGKNTLPLRQNLSDKNFRKYIIFQGQKMAEALTFLRNHTKSYAKEKGKTVVFQTSGTYLSQFTHPHMSLDLLHGTDSAKTEFLNGVRDFLNGNVFNAVRVSQSPIHVPGFDVRLNFGLDLSRDMTGGNPATVWYAAQHLNDAHQARAFVMSVIGSGNSVNFDINGCMLISSPCKIWKDEILATQTAVALGHHLSTFVIDKELYRFAAVQISETERNMAFIEDSIPSMATPAAPSYLKYYDNVWRKVMWPVMAAYKSFKQKGLPVNLISDKQIEDDLLLKGDYKIIYLTTDSEYSYQSDIWKTNINKFKAHGGVVIHHDHGLDLMSAVNGPVNAKAIARLIYSETASLAAIKIDFGNSANVLAEKKMVNMQPQANYFTDPETDNITILISNDVKFVAYDSGNDEDEGQVNGPVLYPSQAPRPERVSGAKIITSNLPHSVVAYSIDTLKNGSDESTQHRLTPKYVGLNHYEIKIPDFLVGAVVEFNFRQ